VGPDRPARAPRRRCPTRGSSRLIARVVVPWRREHAGTRFVRLVPACPRDHLREGLAVRAVRAFADGPAVPALPAAARGVVRGLRGRARRVTT
jgi:hypothetical protein